MNAAVFMGHSGGEDVTINRIENKCGVSGAKLSGVRRIRYPPGREGVWLEIRRCLSPILLGFRRSTSKDLGRQQAFPTRVMPKVSSSLRVGDAFRDRAQNTISPAC